MVLPAVVEEIKSQGDQREILQVLQASPDVAKKIPSTRMCI